MMDGPVERGRIKQQGGREAKIYLQVTNWSSYFPAPTVDRHVSVSIDDGGGQSNNAGKSHSRR